MSKIKPYVSPLSRSISDGIGALFMLGVGFGAVIVAILAAIVYGIGKFFNIW